MAHYSTLNTFRFLVLLVLFPICTIAQDYPEFSVPEALTSKQIRFLASDELLGRMTGEQGYRVAARYIAEHFRMYGLMEPSGAPDYMQKIPLYRQFVSEGNFLVHNADTLHHRPSDPADDSFDFAYLNVFARSYAYTARNLANGTTTPTWTPGDPYEEAYERLVENEQ